MVCSALVSCNQYMSHMNYCGMHTSLKKSVMVCMLHNYSVHCTLVYHTMKVWKVHFIIMIYGVYNYYAVWCVIHTTVFANS